MRPDRRLIATAVGAAVLLVALSVAAYRRGRAGRQPAGSTSAAASVALVPDSAAADLHWAERGVRGQVLVYASRFLHYVLPPVASETPALTEFPFERQLSGAPEVDHRNLLWHLVRRDAARRIEHVVPTSVLAEKVGDGAPVGPIDTHDFGTPRSISDRLRTVPAGSPLGIDASLLLDAEGRELAERLLGRRQEFGDVVLNLAADNPAVDEEARAALRELASRWSGAGRASG